MTLTRPLLILHCCISWPKPQWLFKTPYQPYITRNTWRYRGALPIQSDWSTLFSACGVYDHDGRAHLASLVSVVLWARDRWKHFLANHKSHRSYSFAILLTKALPRSFIHVISADDAIITRGTWVCKNWHHVQFTWPGQRGSARCTFALRSALSLGEAHSSIHSWAAGFGDSFCDRHIHRAIGVPFSRVLLSVCLWKGWRTLSSVGSTTFASDCLIGELCMFVLAVFWES